MTLINDTIWRVKPMTPGAAEELSAALGLSLLTTTLLIHRGITTPEDADAFLNPSLNDLHDPMLLPDMDRAVGRISQAIDSGETIFLHGDYDADGVTSTALGLRALTALGANVVPHVPRRSDGYDLQVRGVEKAQDKGASLIVTADCGTRALPAITRANELGIEVIITDHHRPGPELPPAYAIVNPYREGSRAPFQALCGAGVAFKLMDALVAARRPSTRRSFQQKYLDLVAMGTVADMTPLVGENRILVSHGLRTMRDTTKKGLRCLLDSLNKKGRVKAGDIGWSIGPCLNAAGRMEEAEIAFRLLVTSDLNEAEQLTEQLAALREQSKNEVARVTTEAMIDAMVELERGMRVLVLAKDKWGKGVVGVAATRVVEACRRPVFILSYNAQDDVYTGSGRTRGDFELHTALYQCHDLLGRYGGHSASAGLTVPAANLEAFRTRINEVAMDFVPEIPEPSVLEADAEIADGRLLTMGLLEEIELLEPFGEENREPVFFTRGAEITRLQRVGKDLATLHIDFLFPHCQRPFRGVWFRNGEVAESLRVGEELDVAYTPQINEWQGRVSVQLQIKDLKSPSV